MNGENVMMVGITVAVVVAIILVARIEAEGRTKSESDFYATIKAKLEGLITELRTEKA
jgi:hypothetical protein